MNESMYSVTLNESKIASQETGVMKGCLKNILISSDKPVYVNITLQDNPNIKILELQNFVGDKLITVRTPAQDYKCDNFSYQVEEFYLNDKLLIIVQGSMGANVRVKFRTE